MTTIQIEQLVKHYRGRQQPALDHVSLNVWIIGEKRCR